MKLFCITLSIPNMPAPWTLLYKNEDAARGGWAALLNAGSNTTVELSDDFGQTALVQRASVAGAMFEDLDKSMLAHIERGLHNARTQVKAQQIATNDPVLKTAAMARGQGPMVFDPVQHGRMHG
jgi:hypothetical protein